MKNLLPFLFVFLSSIALTSCNDSNISKQSTPDTAKIEVKKQIVKTAYQLDCDSAAAFCKRNTNDPSSYEFISLTKVDSTEYLPKKLCSILYFHEYRAKNRFGALVKSSALVYISAPNHVAYHIATTKGQKLRTPCERAKYLFPDLFK